MGANDILNLCIEIISCRGLLVADGNGTSDPYVVVKMGGKKIHQTKHVKRTLHPVFSLETHSSFVVNCTKKQFEQCGGLSFIVRDWDVIGHDELGDVMVPAKNFLSGPMGKFGDPGEFRINPPEKRNKEKAGFIKLACRKATSTDMKKLASRSNKSMKFGFKASKSRITTNPAGDDEDDAINMIGRKNKKMSNSRSDLDCSFTSCTSECTMSSAQSMEFDSDALNGHSIMDTFKIEIISCRDLLIADKTSSDPYIKVRLGKEPIHSTKHMKQTLNPLFGPEHNNTFILHKAIEEIDAAGGLRVTVKDFDLVGFDDDLGDISITGTDLAGMMGSPIELKLRTPKAFGENCSAGFITLRCTPATAADMKKYSTKGADRIGGKLMQGVGSVRENIGSGVKAVGGGVVGGVVGVAGTVAGGGVSIVGGGVSFVGQGMAKVGERLLDGENDGRKNVLVGALAKSVKAVGENISNTGNMVADAGNNVTNNAKEAKASIAGFAAEKGEGEEKEKSTAEEPMVIETVPTNLLLRKGSVKFKATIKGNDIHETIELLEMAMNENPNIQWMEFYNLGLSEASEDIQFAKALAMYPKITKICLYDIHILSSCYANPPFLESLANMPNLQELEIRMKDRHELPYPFLTSFLETSKCCKSLVLWNVLFEFGRLQQVYESFVANRKIERFELWQSDAGNDIKFAELTGNMLKFNTTLEKLVLSHIELRGEHCYLLADALKKNCTLKELALINVLDAENAIAALVTLANKKLQTLCVTFEESDYEGCLELYHMLYRNSIIRKCKEIADNTAAKHQGWCSIL